MSKEKEIKIKIDRETLKKLLEQLEQMRRVNVPGIEACNTIEELVSFYIQQIFRMDSILMEGMMCIFKKYIGNDKFQQVFKDILEQPPKNTENTENTSFGSLYDEEEDEDMDDEFYYYDDDEEFEDNGKLEMVDIHSEEYKARQRKDEEEKKKNKK